MSSQETVTLAKAANAPPRRRSLRKDTRGLTTVEYVIVLVLIAVACFGLWSKFGKKVQDGVNRANSEIDLTSSGSGSN